MEMQIKGMHYFQAICTHTMESCVYIFDVFLYKTAELVELFGGARDGFILCLYTLHGDSKLPAHKMVYEPTR